MTLDAFKVKLDSIMELHERSMVIMKASDMCQAVFGPGNHMTEFNGLIYQLRDKGTGRVFVRKVQESNPPLWSLEKIFYITSPRNPPQPSISSPVFGHGTSSASIPTPEKKTLLESERDFIIYLICNTFAKCYESKKDSDPRIHQDPKVHLPLRVLAALTKAYKDGRRWEVRFLEEELKRKENEESEVFVRLSTKLFILVTFT